VENTNEINAGAKVMPSLKTGTGGGECARVCWRGHYRSGIRFRGGKVVLPQLSHRDIPDTTIEGAFYLRVSGDRH